MYIYYIYMYTVTKRKRGETWQLKKQKDALCFYLKQSVALYDAQADFLE